jgi:uncharacterized membrane protein YkvI
MSQANSLLRACIVPAAVFQGVAIAGGYGTGQEVLTFFSRYGAGGGLLGVGLATVALAVVLGTTFEFARRFAAYDYRTFFRRLLGSFWIAFETCFLITLVLVMGVLGSAASTVLSLSAGAYAMPAIACVYLLIVLLTQSGSRTVTLGVAFWAIVLNGVFLAIFVAAIAANPLDLRASLATLQVEDGWSGAAMQFVQYSASVAPAMLFALRGVQTPRQAVGAGVLSAMLYLLPAVLFHVAFLTRGHEILGQPIPVFWLVSQLQLPWLMAAYTLALLGTLVQTASGILQALLDRVDAWHRERHGVPSARPLRFAVIATSILVSLGLAQIGIIALVAQGYGTLAYAYLAVYLIPLLTLGMHMIVRDRRRIAAQGARALAASRT